MALTRVVLLLLILSCTLCAHGHSGKIITRRRNFRKDDPAPAAAPAPAPADAAAAPAAPAAPTDTATPGAPPLAAASASDADIAGLSVQPSVAFSNEDLQPSPYSQELDSKLSHASDLLNKMQADVSTEKDWAKSVHDIIENYQFKYSKSLSDIADREKRVEKLKEVKDQLTQARLHTGVEEEMDKATKDLDDLSSRLGDTQGSKDYSDIKNKVTKIKKKLDALSPTRAANAKDADQKK